MSHANYMNELYSKHAMARIIDVSLGQRGDGLCCDNEHERYRIAVCAIEALQWAGYEIAPGPFLNDDMQHSKTEI